MAPMGMTMTEKILARGAGRESVVPGDLVLARVDFAMGHDLTIPPAGKIMREQMCAEKIWDPDRVAVTQDHFQPAKDAASAALGRLTREFSRDMGVKWYFEVGQGGICHTVLPENGLVLPGELVVGADSHSCTYGALNNFATGIGSTDLACVLALGELWFRVPETLKFDAEKVELGVAKPMSPDNYSPLSEVLGTRLDQVFIGSCTNSRITDLRRAAAVLKGHHVAPGLRLIITPSSHQVAIQAEKEGLIGTFLAAGAAWTTATCGACLGGHMGVLGDGEVCLSTTNRNFPGRMGHPKAQVHLSNPAVAAASAVAGVITHPSEVLAKMPANIR